MSIQLMLVSKATAYLRNLSQQPPLSHCLKKYIENNNCNSCFNYVSLLYKCLLPHHKRSKFVSLHLKNGSMVRVRKYAKFGVFYAKIVLMTPQRLRRESLRPQKFSVTNREPLWLQKFSVTNTVLSWPFFATNTNFVNCKRCNP